MSIERVMETARCAASDQSGDIDLYDVAIEILTVAPGMDIELRIPAAEGIMDAMSGRPYLDDYGPDADCTPLALAYCGGFCLAAPGFGHAGAVREILGPDSSAGPDQTAQPYSDGWVK